MGRLLYRAENCSTLQGYDDRVCTDLAISCAAYALGQPDHLKSRLCPNIQQRSEPAPTLKASMRLLSQIFSGATDVPEFQRQISTPNVPKSTAALIYLAEKHNDREVKVSLHSSRRCFIFILSIS